MIIKNNVPLQEVSWVKSDESLKDVHASSAAHLYYPERMDELIELCRGFYRRGEAFDLIGYASNTLLLPSYHPRHLICTKKLEEMVEDDICIMCECGVQVRQLAKFCVAHGYEGFEGLVDLPGTVAAAVYGNAGCYGCHVATCLSDVEILGEDGEVRMLKSSDMAFSFRSSAMKRGELRGVVLRVFFRKVTGDSKLLEQRAQEAHRQRKATQPPAANNLGTTMVGCKQRTMWGRIVIPMARTLARITRNSRQTEVAVILLLSGYWRLRPYLFRMNRYMFLDVRAHQLFPDYLRLMSKLYKDPQLEIEIRK